MSALLISTVLLGAAAIGVDIARWYVTAERVQTAADSAAMAGVVYLPDNLPKAETVARAQAELNGFEHDGVSTTVDVAVAERRSQLRVTVTTSIDNQFGAAIGVDTATVSRTAVADYTAAAPMGSPCNTFGNEPLGGQETTSGPRAQQSTCNSRPGLWAAIEGPNMDKISGDRYSTRNCPSAAVFRCSGGKNAEGPVTTAGLANPIGHPEGYFFAVRVGQDLVGQAIRLQLFDPVFYPVATACTDNLPSLSNSTPDNLNPYTSDAKTRYASGTGTAKDFCTGDTIQGSNPSPTVTSFALREATDSGEPMAGAGVSACPPVQFRGYTGRIGTSADGTRSALTSANNSGTTANRYNQGFAKTFRQWVQMCEFRPTRAGNYFLQVRTNVPLPTTGAEANTNGHSPVIYRGNTKVLDPTGALSTGDGANAFAIRAVPTSRPDLASQVAVSGWARMPMLQNDPDTTAEFHMLRVLPSAAGQSIRFEFFDVADISTGATGTISVVPPPAATGKIKTEGLINCQEAKNESENYASSKSGCAVAVSNSANNGQLHKMRIPIPSDYWCNEDVQADCWFKIKVDMTNATSITDFTTWNARLEGDPVRLIE